jgi:periplasmic protein TonB
LPRSYARPIPNPLPTVGVSGSAARREPAAAPTPATGGAMIPGIVSADALDRVAFRDPVYPPQALRNGTRGWVEVEFTIMPTGSVGDIAVIAAEPQGVFESAATAAVAEWRYRPRTVNGRPMSQRATVTLRFDVDG